MLSKLNRRDEKGFTLIELLIVIAIIGVLAGLAVAQFVSYRTRAYNTMAESDLRNAATAQEGYYATYEAYSNNIGNLVGVGASQGVHLDVNGTSSSAYTMAAYHTAGNATYTLIGPGGAMTKD